MATVGGPVHGVDFGKMALEVAARAHPDSREGVSVVLSDLADCWNDVSKKQKKGRVE